MAAGQFPTRCVILASSEHSDERPITDVSSLWNALGIVAVMLDSATFWSCLVCCLCP